MHNAHETIWLQIDPDGESFDPEQWSLEDGATWCKDQISANDVKYVRADIAEAELEAARAEIELERTSLQQTERLLHKPAETIAAQQARIWELRNALSMPCDRWNKTQHGIVCKALSTPSDTSALEAIVKKAGEVMRERSINVAWNNEPDCNGPIEMEIRALPAVTLDDLK